MMRRMVRMTRSNPHMTKVGQMNVLNLGEGHCRYGWIIGFDSLILASMIISADQDNPGEPLDECTRVFNAIIDEGEE